MVAHYDDDMLPEYDFSKAVRGAFANWFTPEQREKLLRESAYGVVEATRRYARECVQAVETSLFTYLMLAGGQPGQRLADGEFNLNCLGDRLSSAKLVPPRFASRIRWLVAEREWMEHFSLGPYTGSGAFIPEVLRLETIRDEAKALKVQIDRRIQQHLARSGLSEQEIERKTEETARLWQAA